MKQHSAASLSSHASASVIPASIPVLDSHQVRRIVGRINSALRDSQGGGIMERLDTIIKILVAKVFDESEKDSGIKANYEFAHLPSDDSNTTNRRLKDLYERATQCPRYAGIFQGQYRRLSLDSIGAARITTILHPFRLSVGFHDTKGSAFQEVLRNTFDKNENQQFFTPSEVAGFMGDVAAVAVDRPLHEVVVCDPAVGTGGLLLGVVQRAIQALGDNPDSRRVEDYVKRCVYGVDIDERMAWIAAINIALLTDAAANIFHLNGGGGSLERRRNQDRLAESSFDLIITNPPFGSDVLDSALLNQYQLGKGKPSRRRSVLFVERCLQLLKPGGTAVIILDDSVLNQPTTADVRALLRRQAAVQAVFSLPDTAFMPYASVKASVLVFKKKPGASAKPTLMVDIQETGRKPNGQLLYGETRGEDGARLLRSDLPVASQIFNFYSRGEMPTGDEPITSFIVSEDDQRQTAKEDDLNGFDDRGRSARLDVVRYHPLQREALATLETSPYPVVELRELVNVRSERVNPSELPDEVFRYVGLADIEKLTGQWYPQEVRGDVVKSTCNAFYAGDIIFARMRPNLRKVVLVPDSDEGGICSSECAVLTLLNEGDLPVLKNRQVTQLVDARYIAWILRSDVVYGQIMAKITGVGRPRVSTSSLLRVRIPLPPIEAQRKLSSHLEQSWSNLIRIRGQVQNQLLAAERSFEETLQNPFALHWI